MSDQTEDLPLREAIKELGREVWGERRGAWYTVISVYVGLTFGFGFGFASGHGWI